MKSVNKKAGKSAKDLLNGKATITNGRGAGNSLDPQNAVLESSANEPNSCPDGMCPVTWKPRRQAA
ncbi:MAG: hypothetical protein C5B53_03970 [Candidatus Melainabacteria bacterium]|nr:MAG: hypothetical protein C5B53_03970 [Candidatus Melainabacteria bacterium]